MVGEPAINAHPAASAWVRLKNLYQPNQEKKKHPTITTSDTRVRRVSAKIISLFARVIDTNRAAGSA